MLTSQGRVNLKQLRFARDDEPLDPDLAASPANRWSRAYLRHLLQVGEPAVARILTMHNVTWLFDLVDRARRAIRDGTIDQLVAETLAVWGEEAE